MSRKLLIFVAVVVVGGFMTGLVTTAMAAPEIIGAPGCKMCHKAKTGDQWAKWEGSKHAGAFATLATEEAKKIAAEKGLGDPQTEAACLKCHATKAFLGPEVALSATTKYVDAEGVGCEACHGAGSDYKSKNVMEDSAAAKAAGLIMDKTEASCTKCHNAESPTFKGFDFAARWKEIEHPVPAAQ